MITFLLKIAYTLNTLIEGLIILRLVLSIFASNSTHSFVQWVYSMSDLFINPFEGIAPSTLIIDRFEIAVTPILALIFYAVLGFILSELVKALKSD